jgi:hypothetical protein
MTEERDRFLARFPFVKEIDPLYSEILPGLFLGGVALGDTIFESQGFDIVRTDLPFDSIVTLWDAIRPADWKVQEFRYGIPDAKIEDFDLKRFKQLVNWGYAQWKSGDRVLVRCGQGYNRSGLVMALILVKEGLSAETAVMIIRGKRGERALNNKNYETWLMEHGESFIR